jgi:hypothetical protein
MGQATWDLNQESEVIVKVQGKHPKLNVLPVQNIFEDIKQLRKKHGQLSNSVAGHICTAWKSMKPWIHHQIDPLVWENKERL